MPEEARTVKKDPKPDSINLTRWGFAKMLMNDVKERAAAMEIRGQLSKQDIMQMANDLNEIIDNANEAATTLTNLALFDYEE